MSQQIGEVLNRRTDLSTFVVHLTRSRAGNSARNVLDSIIKSRTLRAESAMGWAKEHDKPSDPDAQSQRVVCFSETPLEHIYSLVAEIEGRSVNLEPYGVAFTKMVARRSGINPIWYVDQTPRRIWKITAALNELKQQAVDTGYFHSQPIAEITPYLEQMGTWASRGTRKEFWWEREWRHVGNLSLPFQKLIWLCPEDEIATLTDHDGDPLREPVIDPRWGLEQIIAHLAGFKAADITPFDVN